MSNEDTALVPVEGIRLGSFQVATSHDVVERASVVAKELASIIRERRLFVSIRGKEFVKVEGWSTLGAMLGITAREVSALEQDDGSWEAVVEIIRVNDGMVIGRGSALCGTDEQVWADRARYARRSMAITRATGKAFRLAFSWIMTLAGYEPTPAEEIPDEREQQSHAAPESNGAPSQAKLPGTNGRGSPSAAFWAFVGANGVPRKIAMARLNETGANFDEARIRLEKEYAPKAA